MRNNFAWIASKASPSLNGRRQEKLLTRSADNKPGHAGTYSRNAASSLDDVAPHKSLKARRPDGSLIAPKGYADINHEKAVALLRRKAQLRWERERAEGVPKGTVHPILRRGF